MAELDGKKLETRLKKVAVASACTLTGPTGYQPKEPNDGNLESLEDKVRRVRQEGSVYRWDEKEEGDETGKT